MLWVIGSLALSVWSLEANWRGNLIVAGFSLATGIASLLWLLLAMANVVIRFELECDSLTYTRLGRRTRKVILSEVVSVDLPAKVKQRWGFWDGATVGFRDGRTMFLSYRDLEHASALAELLGQMQNADDDSLSGRLISQAIAGTLVAQALITFLLFALVVIAVLILGVAFHPKPGIAEPRLFLGLGGTLLLLGACGLYFGVFRYWIGCVRWYSLNGRDLQYQTVFSSHVVKRLTDELDLVVARRPTSAQAEIGSWRMIRFRDGERIKLQLGILQNASELYSRLKKISVARKLGRIRQTPPAIGGDHPYWANIRPYVEQDEQVWWIGRPVYAKLWSEMTAELILGLIPGSLGLFALILGTDLVWRGDLSALLLVLLGTLFIGVGGWGLATPWRYRRMLQDTVYAVTSRRALIVNGLAWGSQMAVVKTSASPQSFLGNEAMNYEVNGRGRDVVLGGEWRAGRKGRHHWYHHGFLATADLASAIAALEYLVSTHVNEPHGSHCSEEPALTTTDRDA